MNTDKYIVAIEIGSSKIIGAIATRSPKGVISILGVDTIPIGDAIKRGIIVRPREIEGKIIRLIRLLNNRIGTSKKIVRAYVGISGQSLHAEDYTLSRDYPEDTIISEELIHRLQEEVKEMPIAGADVLEVVRTDVLVDNNPYAGYDKVEGSNVKVSLKLITARKALKQGAISAIPADLSVIKYLSTDLTTPYVALTAEDRQAGVMLVDFGSETTSISIYKNGKLNYLSTIPLGGANITRDIVSLQVAEEEAESFKVRLGSAKVTGDEADITLRGEYGAEIKSSDLAKVVKARIEEIVANVNAHFEYAKCDPDSLGAGMVIVGDASKLSNLTELLAEKCGIRVRKGALRQDMLLDLSSQSKTSEYLQILGLIFAGTESCIEVEQPVVTVEPEPIVEPAPKPAPQPAPKSQPQPAPKPQPQPAPKSQPESEPEPVKKPGILGRIGRTLGEFSTKLMRMIDEDETPAEKNLWDDEQEKNDNNKKR